MDDGGCSAFITILFFVFLVLEAIMFGFSQAIHLMNEKEIERRAMEENDKKSIFLFEIVKRSTIYVNSIQLIISLVEVLVGYLFLPTWTVHINRWLSSFSVFENFDKTFLHRISIVIACSLLMYVLLSFGILLPKKLAKRKPDQWAYFLIPFIRFLKNMLYPLTWIIAISTKFLLKILGLGNSDEQVDVTEEEIISMVNEGHEQGVLEASEAEMITNIFEYGDKEASDIMTHRNNVIAIESEMLLLDALNLMLKESNSRYPVYEENLDHIIGILNIKDAMRLHTSDESLNAPVGKIEGLLRDAVFVPETKNIDDLFKSMQSEKNQMVIVMDEYGQTSGLVTMEDILEEIVGNIMDEYDADENHIEEKGNNEYLIEGMTKLEDLEERFDIHFEECEFETLNGYLIFKLDRIPNEGETPEIISEGYSFKILQVEKNVIQSVLVTKLPETEIVEDQEEQ